MGNGLSYHVFFFQRDYSWTEDEWDDLWQDLLGLFEPDGEPAHYMGYLVLQSSDSKRFDIIDGQQRLTTISVMLLAGLGHLQDLVEAGLDAERNTVRKEQFRGSYIGYLDPVTLVPRSKLELNRHNNHLPCSFSSFLGTPLCVLCTIASFCKPGVAAQFPGKRAVTPAQASGHFPAAQAQDVFIQELIMTMK